MSVAATSGREANPRPLPPASRAAATAFSEGPNTVDGFAAAPPAAEPVPAADASRDRAAHFVEVAKQYAETLPADELENEIADLEQKLDEARAARKLRDIRTELERVVREFPETNAAKTAADMLLQQPAGGTLQPVPATPFRRESDLFELPPAKER